MVLLPDRPACPVAVRNQVRIDRHADLLFGPRRKIDALEADKPPYGFPAARYEIKLRNRRAGAVPAIADGQAGGRSVGTERVRRKMRIEKPLAAGEERLDPGSPVPTIDDVLTPVDGQGVVQDKRVSASEDYGG